MEKTKNKKKKSKSKLGKSLIIIFVITILGTMALVSYGKKYIEASYEPMDKDNPVSVTINIPPSSSTTFIANKLHENGLIKNQLIFKYQVNNRGLDGQLKAGEYELSTGMDLNTIIDNIIKGSKNLNTVRFTIPEGYEIRQMAEKLSEEGIVNKDRFLELTRDKSNFEEKYTFLKELEDGQNLEGFLFPSTYEIYVGASEEEVIGKMLSEFNKIYKKDIEPKIGEFDLSLNEIITLASIIEREGKLDSERPLMSAVFHNRIEQGMMLQSCATVQFILGERKEVLSNEDTSIESPYNTYINEGLPPGPIASPGEASLIASVNPADVDYLFFVLTGDDGSHTFTRTYGEHLNAKPKK